MPELTPLGCLLCIAGPLGREGPTSAAPTAQWKSVIFAYRSGATGTGSLRARTFDLILVIALWLPRRVPDNPPIPPSP